MRRECLDRLLILGGRQLTHVLRVCPLNTSIEGQIFNVFTLRDGRIVRIDDYRRRTEAFSAAGIPADAGWH